MELERSGVPATELHRITPADALAMVDGLLGAPDSQLSGLMEYRLSSAWQSDWKVEVGQWLNTAQQLGFLNELWGRVVSRLGGASPIAVDIESNDERHLMLQSDLAPAMLVHYLTGLGWTFEAWEPRQEEHHHDVDVALVAPNGVRVLVQVKAPDKPGERANHQIINGESDRAVVASMLKAAAQLPTTGDAVKMIAISPRRVWPFTSQPGAVVSELFGSSIQYDRTVVLLRSKLGRFQSPAWVHVAGVLLLDFVRPLERPNYQSIALINPWAKPAADPHWFPRSRVCSIEGDEVRWRGGAPVHAFLPHGTRVVDREPI